MRSFNTTKPVFCGGVAILATLSISLGLEPPRNLIEGLGAEAYPERVAAEKGLQSWAEDGGEAAKEWLYEQHSKSSDPEVRRGALSVLRSVVIRDLASQRPGFVGIGMAGVKFPDGGGTEGYGIEIQSVNSGSPADKAGLKVTDVILKLNGKGWSKPDAQHEFAGRIGALRGGDTIQIELLRGESTEVIELVLAPRPWSQGIYNEKRQQRGDPFAARNRSPRSEREAEEEAFQEWMKRRQSEAPKR